MPFSRGNLLAWCRCRWRLSPSPPAASRTNSRLALLSLVTAFDVSTKQSSRPEKEKPTNWGVNIELNTLSVDILSNGFYYSCDCGEDDAIPTEKKGRNYFFLSLTLSSALLKYQTWETSGATENSCAPTVEELMTHFAAFEPVSVHSSVLRRHDILLIADSPSTLDICCCGRSRPTSAYPRLINSDVQGIFEH